ncbi:MAG: NUDIX domain-containing protein [Patescibacteria group bacterium]|jgi:8-oxo-dGTP diphosphatase
MDDNRPKVGVGIMVLKNGKVLFGQRKNAHGDGEFSFPGGHLEHGESIIDCAKRETKEETGIEIENVRLLCVSNEKKYLPKHYLNIGLIADWKSNEPKITEPDKYIKVGWYDLENLPKPRFEVVDNYLEAYKTGKKLFDY